MEPRLLILGAGGMLGRALEAEARRRNWTVFAATRHTVDVTEPAAIFMELHHARPHVVINAAGIIPERNSDPTFTEMIRVNAIAPRLIAAECRRRGVPFIHVSTDCVVDDSVYGRSKALGEVLEPGCVNVRTSFVGPGHGLWEYIASRPQGAEIIGYGRASWSGSTVGAVASGLVNIAVRPPSADTYGLIGLGTESPITKHDVCRLLIEHLGRGDLELRTGGPCINRAFEPTVAVPSLEDALKAERNA